MRRARRTAALCAACAVVGAAFAGLADTVRLKNGDVLQGVVTRQDTAVLVLKTPFGEMAVPKTRIADVRIDAGKKEEPPETVYLRLASGTNLSGRILRQTATMLTLLVGAATNEIAKTDVARLSWRPIIDEKPRVIVVEKTRWDAAWRSALLPAWGQFHAGSTAKGWIVAAAVSGLGIAAVAGELSYGNKLDAYRAPGVHDTALWNAADAARRRANLLWILLGAAYALNVTDAAFLSPARTREPAGTALLAPVLRPDGGGLALTLSF